MALLPLLPPTAATPAAAPLLLWLFAEEDEDGFGWVLALAAMQIGCSFSLAGPLGTALAFISTSALLPEALYEASQ